jgi:hypothetical protein
VPRRRRPVEEALGQAELDQQVRVRRGVGRLIQRPGEVGDAALGRAARERAARRLPQDRDGLPLAARGRLEQMRGDPLRLGAGRAEHRGRPEVGPRALLRIEPALDGGLDHRVHEPQRRIGVHEVGGLKFPQGREGDVLVQPGERGHVPELSAAAQHGQGGRQRLRRLGQPREARPDRAPDRLPADPAQRRRRDAVLRADGADELAEQQRVPATLGVAGGDQRVAGPVAQLLRDDLRARALAQRRRVQDGGERVRREVREQVRMRRRLERARGGDDERRDLAQARQRIREPAQRRAVAPVQVVEEQHERAPAGQVGGEPVKPVERRERRVRPAGRRGEVRGVEHGAGRGGRPGEELVAGVGAGGRDERLEELADDAVGELALELQPARGEYLVTGRDRAGARGLEQARLADAPRALDEDEPAAVTGGVD